MIALRTVGPDDWLAWRELRLAALAEAPHAFGSTLAEWQDESEERWRARLAIPDSHNVLVVADDRPVGMASGVPEDGRAELISMWVSPTARGMGVGNVLIAEIARWAAGRADALYLSVMPDNAAAIALYARNGFVDTGEPGDLLADGVRREILMAKAL
ncbi:MAG TPA: GNAT family N-acetyltransferase [Pseudonocardiaceae bacterium]|jgi:ribosomal protein S18 acetylase RimI-like enzyme